MKVYNTLTRKKEDFKPLQEGKVGIYYCGPTVYDVGHLGHGMASVSFDVIRKYFIYKGFEVTFVSNYTDVDDKMIKRANERGITVKELTDEVIPLYEEDYGALGVMPGDVHPKATEHIGEMVDLIKVLEDKGATYVTSDGVYFDILKFEDYGKLSRQKLDELREGVRIEKNDEKRNPQDFVLWKFSKPEEPVWESPWGDGRPGWHIECSAMSSKYLGKTFDIHTGGADLIFPHHECEIAQSEVANGQKFVNYWLHNGHIRVNKEKMSKSLGNFFLLRDIFEKFKPQVVRFMFLQSHYRSPIDFSDELLEQAANGLTRLHDFVRRLDGFDGDGATNAEVIELVDIANKNFIQAMDDDFETPQALAACFDLVKSVNRLMDEGSFNSSDKDIVLKFLKGIDAVLGIFFAEKDELAEEVEKLIGERDQARKDKNFARSDEIRDELLNKGIQLEDAVGGTIWKRI